MFSGKYCLRYTPLLALFWLLGLGGCYLEAVRYRPPPADNPGFKLPAMVKVSQKECLQNENDAACKPATTWLSSWKAGRLEVGLKEHLRDVATDSVGEMVVYENRSTDALLGFGIGAAVGCLVPWVIMLIAGAAGS